MDEGNSCSSGRVSLPHIRKLKLSGIDNDSLMHGGGIKASVHPLLPNVEILEVELCAGIKNLMASAISFRNVTTLKVISCKGLVYLMTYAVAKSFVQLITMEVRSCERIVVIVGSTDADPNDVAPNEIIFSRLQRLTLSYLPSLRGFCSSGYCNVKIPSLTSLIVEFCSINFKISNGLLMNSRTSRISIMENIMDELKNPNTMRIGIWGSGGVGKTTLAKKIYKQATLDKMLFDDVVILLDVKRNPNLEEIQKKIVEKLGMDILDNETVEKRASCLRARIKEKKILVILDDVWKQIDLVAVGLPSVNTCKILLTSSIGKTLSDMNTQKEVLLDILEEKESWDLFQEKTGDAVLDDPAIRTVAKQVAENCGGLSVLVVIMASALKQITSLAAWEDALTCLKAKSDKGEELTEQARSGIKWSYNQLSDKELKPLFLLCGITIRGNYICLEDLLKYIMSLGFFSKAFKVGKARDVLHSRIKKLKDLCLLTDSSDNRYVRMPDLVRDVANQIAFRDQHILSLVEDGGNRELKELSDKYFLEKCTIMSFPSSKNIPMLLEVMYCPALRMFHLQGDLDADSQKIPTRFFEEMKNLQVLSLQCMTIPSLPISFHSLKNLSSLCLDKCRLGDVTLIGELSNVEILSLSGSDVTHLPKELVGKLTHLRLLDLSDCSKLEMISPGFISSIGRLEELRMRNSFNKWETEGKSTNASLSELNSCQLLALEIHILSANILPENLFSHDLERFNIILGDAYMWEKPMVETTLNTLKVKLTTSIEELSEGLKNLVKRSEDLSLYVEGGMNNIVQSLDTQDFVHLKHLQLQSNVDFNHIINRKVVFPSLMTLRVHRCDRPSSLFSFSMPESHVELEHLQISTCKILEESQSSTREYSQENMDNVFSKQEDLKLNGSPNITRFCSRSIENLDIEGWVKLKAYDAAMSRNSKIWKLMEETHSEENNIDTIRYFLFDLKAVFQNLTTLTVDRCDHLSFLFSVDMIKSLVKLKHLEISTCESIKEVVSSSENGEENMENVFPNLEILKLNELPKLTRFCSGSSIVFRSLEMLDIRGCTKLGTFISENVAMSGKDTRIYEETEEKDSVGNYSSNTVHHFLFDEKIGLPKLTNLVVRKCNGLSFLSSVARSLEQLKDVLISECDIMKAILKEEYIEEFKEKIFPDLIQLKLNALPFLNRFCSGSSVVFPLLKGLHIEKCTKLETFICNPLSNSSASLKETEERNTDQNIVTVIQDFLFDNKVGFPELVTLTIIDLPKLKSIWHTQLALDSFHELQDVRVQKCDSLKTILPDSLIASVFQQLRNLIVEECGVENIVSQGLEGQFDFPKLIHLEFKSLSNLEKFSPGMPAFSWPQLKTLVLLNCKTLDIFAREVSGHQDTQVRKPSILINQKIFNTLEDLTLVPNKICYGRPTSAVCCKKAVFAGISNRHTDVSLPCLKTLRLHGMEKFMRLWDIEPAGKEFPLLEILEVKFSGFNSLQLSSLFFKNLTTLEVTFCWRLQYLTTYSVAQRLSQLKILKVDECKSMKEIFASEGIREDDSNGEIVFSQLQHLELSDLISLERFCSNKCTVKAPKLEKLDVNGYSIKLKSPSLEVDINMHLDVKKSHSSKKALNSTESALSSGNIQKQPATNASEGAEHIEVMDLNQKQIVTNTSKNLQEADFDMQENRIERLEEELRTKKADIRHLEELLRALKPEREREREVNRVLEDAHLCENPNREDHHLEVESKLSSNTINVKAKI